MWRKYIRIQSEQIKSLTYNVPDLLVQQRMASVISIITMSTAMTIPIIDALDIIEPWYCSTDALLMLPGKKVKIQALMLLQQESICIWVARENNMLVQKLKEK